MENKTKNVKIGEKHHEMLKAHCEKNGLKISRRKEKIYSSIFIYTGINVPKIVVPFLEYHSFYIPCIVDFSTRGRTRTGTPD